MTLHKKLIHSALLLCFININTIASVTCETAKQIDVPYSEYFEIPVSLKYGNSFTEEDVYNLLCFAKLNLRRGNELHIYLHGPSKVQLIGYVNDKPAEHKPRFHEKSLPLTKKSMPRISQLIGAISKNPSSDEVFLGSIHNQDSTVALPLIMRVVGDLCAYAGNFNAQTSHIFRRQPITTCKQLLVAKESCKSGIPLCNPTDSSPKRTTGDSPETPQKAQKKHIL